MKCGKCGGIGHNVKTCDRKNGVRADGARVRELAPGVPGRELMELDPVRGTRRASRAEPSRALSGAARD